MSKREDPLAKLAAKRQVWLERTCEALRQPPEVVLPLLKLQRQQSIRINPLRGEPDTTVAELQKLGWLGEPYAWAINGYELAVSVEQIRDSQLVTDGKIFIQNAASWLPVIALDPQEDEKILDVCAAPGGKASHIAAVTNNQALLTVNDNSRTRLAKMQANFGRLHVTPVDITLYDATNLASKNGGHWFDKILLDAPCSGEGLIRYDRAKDFDSWSVAHIKRLSKLQKQIILQAWKLVKPGGVLVYSTCTMAPEENESVIDFLLRVRPDAALEPFDIDLPNRVPAVKTWNNKAYAGKLDACVRLQPSEHLEAFFVAILRKADDINATKLANKAAVRYDDEYYV